MARKKTGRKRLPPNVGVNNGNVRYRCLIPRDLESIAEQKVYQEYLTTLTPKSSFDDTFEIAKPVILRFEALIKSLKKSSIDAYTEKQIEAIEALRSELLKPTIWTASVAVFSNITLTCYRMVV